MSIQMIHAQEATVARRYGRRTIDSSHRWAQMDTDEVSLRPITERIIGCAYRVASKLGCGFLEKCYANALAYELRKEGLNVVQEVALKVKYEGIVVGEYVADMIVEGSVLVELKAIESLNPVHIAQCINYLAATNLPLCLLINFGKRVQVKRIAGASLVTESRRTSVPICAPSVANQDPEERDA